MIPPNKSGNARRKSLDIPQDCVRDADKVRYDDCHEQPFGTVQFHLTPPYHA
jgi:hypothetical protein